MADDKNKTGVPQTLQLDEEAPQTLQLDEAAGGSGTPSTTVEPTEQNLPGSTPLGRAAIKNGVSKMVPPTKFEQGKQLPENYGFTPRNVLGNIWEGAKGLVGSGYEVGKDLLTLEGKNKQGEEVHGLGGIVGMDPEGHFNPLPRISALAHKYAIDPAAAEQAKSQEVLADTNEPAWKRQLESAGHSLASEIPLVGPWAAHLGEKAGTGDIGGTVGEAAGTIGAGEVLPKIAEHAPAIADKVARGTPITEAGKLEAAKQQALTVKKPSMTETEYAGQVNAAMPDLQKIAQDNQGKIKTPRQAVQAINSRISQIEQPLREHLEQLPPEEVVHPDQYVPQIKAAVDQALSGRSGSYTPQEMEKARNTVLNFIGEDTPKRPIEIERNRQRLNQDADAYYHADTAGKRAIDVSDATAVAQRAAANKIRDIMYGDAQRPGQLENFGVTATDATGQQVPIRDVRKQVGNLINVRDHFEDAITRAEATGDWKAFDKWRSGPSLAAGGLGVLGGAAAGGPLGALFGALAGEGVKAWTDYLNSKNPNLNTQKMFRNLADTSAPNVSEIQTRAPIRQHAQPIGPQLGYAAPIGPQPAPAPFKAPMAVPTAPPNAAGTLTPIGSVQNPSLLGTRGQGGVRTPIHGLFPEQIASHNVPEPQELGPITGLGEEGTLGKIGEPEPRRVYRAQDVGDTRLNPRSHAHATESLEEAEKYREGRESVQSKPQEIRSVNLSKLKPEDYTEFNGPNGKKWVKFNRQLTAHELEEIKEVQKKR